MKRLSVFLASAFAAASIVSAACSQPAAPPSPTAAPPTAAKAAEPTKAAAPTAAAQPTKAAAPTTAPQPTTAPAPKPTAAPPTPAPAKKVDWPEKGKPITLIVPWATGGGNDVFARLLATYLEKELGTPVQVLNKPGASTQIGLTELAAAKPDGYTLGSTSTITTVLVYLDPERKATFTRKDFQPVAVGAVDPLGLGVSAEGRYKTTKDLVDAAKAAPEKVSVADGGYMSPSHVGSVLLAKVAGVKLSYVHMNSGAENIAAVLGGHTDGMMTGLSAYSSTFKAGTIRILGSSDTEENKLSPGVKPFVQQGYNLVQLPDRAVIAPAGVPGPIVELLSAAIKRVFENPEFLKRAADASLTLRYGDTRSFASQWDELDKMMKPILEEAKAEQTK